MKYNYKKELLPLSILIAGWILGIYFYYNFPEKVITHWNFKGIADGYSGKTFGSLFFPAIMTIMYLFFLILPGLDPKKENYQKFSREYSVIKNIILVFFLGISAIAGAVNLGYNIPINTAIPAMIGVLFIILGFLMRTVEQNWFVGFRLPWTLSSELVWKKTNRFGGWALVFFGGLMLMMPIMPEPIAMIFFACGIILVIFGTAIYSYLIYRNEQKIKAETNTRG